MAKRNIYDLPKINSTETCNARTMTEEGYCKHIAGFRTEHPKKGRCYLHDSRGATAIQQHSSASMTENIKPTLRERIERIKRDPTTKTLENEFIMLKAIMAEVVFELGENPKDWLETSSKKEYLEQEKRIDKILKLNEQINKTFKTIQEHEERQKRLMNITQLMGYIKQIGFALNDICKDCPKRKLFKDRLQNVKVVEAEFQEINEDEEVKRGIEKYGKV
jgi:hypothetical protein